MSRCFPFPPPGYEKKARPDDDANILIKEKQKEKKHKKDKKDKEKKEKKEKKDKERSGEKNGERKDRKRKHKDKDKNKEKEEKKDSEDKKVGSSSSHQHSEKLGPIGIQVDQTQQGRPLLELEKRDGNQNGPNKIRSLDKSNTKEISVKSSGKELESNHGILVEGNQKFKDNRVENKMPNGQTLKVSAKHLENGSLGNILSKEQKIVEGAVCQEEKMSEKRKEQKDKNKHKKDGRGDKHKDRDRERKSKSKDKKEKKEKVKEEKVKEVSALLQSKLIENDNNSVDIQNDRGSYPFKGSNLSNGSLGKRKEPEMNGLVHGNGNSIGKLPRPLSSSKVEQNGSRNNATNPGIRFAREREAAEAKHKLDAKASQSISEKGTKLDSRQTAKNHVAERPEAVNNHHHKASESLSSSQSSLGIGGKLDPCQTAMTFANKEQGMVTNKKLNKVLSSQPIDENGRKLESSQPSTFSSAERKGAVSKPKFSDQEKGINGLGLRKSDVCPMRSSPVSDQPKESVEAHLKPPHPDAKYLAEILAVPKVEWSDIDDLSWLFPGEDHGGKKPKIDSTTLEESKKVWAEALQLESADVTALPYVIPY